MKTLKEALFSRRNIKHVELPYGLKEEDLKGDIKNIPMGVVVRMLEEQSKQRGKMDIKILQKSRRSGFYWEDTEPGYDFWNMVISRANFDLFFERYPDYARYNLT